MRSKSLAFLLSVVLVLLMGTMQVNMASHAVDHEHHNGTTHSTSICAWMCMAAQSVSTDAPTFTQKFLPLGFVEGPTFSSIVGQLRLLFLSRGPPL